MIAATLLLLLSAQEPRRAVKPARFVRVEVQCTALAGDDVYLDRGRDAGIEPGDTLRMFAAQGPVRLGKIASVSRTSARADMKAGLDGLDIGLRGEVLVPKARLAQPSAAHEQVPIVQPGPGTPPGPEPRTIEHPPWTMPPDEWNQELPLLAPAHGVAPEERPRRFRGQLLASADWTSDSAGDVERRFLASALGFEGRIENPFAHGGELAFDAEAFARSSDTGSGSERDSTLRLDRMSYALGGMRGESSRGELGRFLPREFPEFGFLDGIEIVQRLRSGHRIGASAGFLPEPDDLFRSFNDLEAALFGRWVSGEEQRVVLGTGYQKTWHEGVPDRDLLALQVELHPAATTSLFASALVDWYSAGDDLKNSGPELTQLFVNGTHRTEDGHGVGCFASRFRFPELLRNEFGGVTAQDIADSVSNRLGLDGWLALGTDVQLYGRVESWSDQDDSGGGGRARITWREAFGRGGPILFESYVNAGKFTRAAGLRASGRKRFDGGAVGLGWDAAEYDQDTIDESLLQHSVRADCEFELGRTWFLGFYAESRFGDEQDALSLGFVLQRSFD